MTTPVAEWVEPVEMLADPYPTYRRLLDESPIAWVPALNRYLATSAAACRAIEEDQQTYTANVSGGSALMARALGARPMLRKDDPEHAAERRPINPTLRPKTLRGRWAPVFERNARTQLAVLRERGPDDADLNRDYAGPVAAQNLIDLLGLTGAGVDDMQRWSHAFIAGTGNLHDDPDIWRRCDEARREVDALLDELIPHYRAHPDDTITSALVHAGLPLGDVAANVKLTISGGMNEPQHVVTNAVWALSRHPGQRDRVLTDPSQWPAVFDETVRWLSPIGMYPRETTRPVVLHDVPLPARAPIGVVVAAANRDATAFERPDAFDIARPREPHLGFGSGTHLCAGHWAARISVGEIAVPLLYAELPGLRTDPRRAEEWHGWVFRGLTTLPVTW
ncbi:cytochrome P450 [Pseudonocardia sp. DSM 110487]|uniref:cytochrome P450 n=1 Tax=Pseudonocardia sp. DSM 110487 TaxID=2865833 RepID=UPI001C69A55B|nr:cytochrome P450 [Pseudonocardia sp. DSM 110487]QYN39072.1 cytochrome P450 [Pseudonocardia sp. DSM 110487]